MLCTPTLPPAPGGTRASLCTSGTRESRAAPVRGSCRIPQTAQQPFLPPPVAQHFHVQIEIHGAAHQPLDARARRLTDRFDGPPLVADHDPLLAVPLDIDR